MWSPTRGQWTQENCKQKAVEASGHKKTLRKGYQASGHKKTVRKGY